MDNVVPPPDQESGAPVAVSGCTPLLQHARQMRAFLLSYAYMASKPPFVFKWLLVIALVAGFYALVSRYRETRQNVTPQPALAADRAADPRKSRPPSEPLSPKEPAIQPQVPADPAATALIAQLLDNSLPLKNRRQAARDLAKLNSDAAMAGLKQGLSSGPPYLKAAMGEALGESKHPEARSTLLGMIAGDDETAARGAVRGLAERGDAEAAEDLSNVLFDKGRPESVRTEAALALGDVQQPAAVPALIRAITTSGDEAITEHALDGLGKHPFTETGDFFRQYLEAPDTPADAKVSALEALGNAPDEVAPFLLKYASDSDPDIRAAAAWALNSSENTTPIGPQLVDWLKQESSAEVRARLYQALGAQDGYDVGTVLSAAQQEKDPTARLAGLGLLAQACRSGDSAAVATFFNDTALPELKNTALTDTSSQNRLASVMALRRAGTQPSVAALQDIAQQSQDHKVIEAAQSALNRSNPPMSANGH